jgi:tetratricopeptide (TPR) repeat protein
MFIKLNHSLQLQFDGLFSKLAGDFVSKEVYLLEGDDLTALGRPYSIRINLLDGAKDNDREYELWEDINEDELPEIAEDTLQNDVLKYVLMQLRLFYDIKPVADEYMRSVLRGKLNEKLKFYDTVAVDESVASFTIEGERATIGSVIKRVADDSIIDDILQDTDLDYAKRLMSQLRYDEALDQFLPLVARVKPGSMFDTELNMYIGEIYYHIHESAKALEYYGLCNPKYITDMRDFHIRIGHCLLDDKAGLRSGLIKMYYRCILNPTYKKSISDRYDRLKDQVDPIYEDHEAKCEEAGAAWLENRQ